MKKLLTFAAAALMLVSCNAKADKAAGGLSDSVSVAMGKLYGSGISNSLKTGPDSAKFNADEFLKGVDYALSVDTAEFSKLSGVELGLNLRKMQKSLKERQNVDLNIDMFIAEFKKAFKSDSMPNMQELEMELMNLMQRATAEAKANDPKAKANKEAGAKYLEEKVKEGYTKTESGIAYKVITEGKGENFTADQRIDIRYEGKLIDGTVFDSTQGDETRPMSPNQVVPGFKEALLLMKPGMKIEVVIPGDLAYGVDGRGGLIGPNATLIFTIEAVGVHAEK
ncbi:MAG: FKBP-type peptidyl-prolyl cis-trans isomerase [Muribaculaceae bacterium]